MSQPMLDKAKSKGIYGKLICSLVGGGNRIQEVEDDSYDVVLVSGGYAQAHMPVDSLREICRVVKPGKSSVTVLYVEIVDGE